MHVCCMAAKVSVEDGQKLTIFAVMIGTKGDWVYLRSLDTYLDRLNYDASMCTYMGPSVLT